jgi:transposase
VRVAEAVSLSTSERRKLERVVKSRASGARLIERAQIALLADRGLNNVAIAEQLGTNVMKVGRWRKRFALHGFTGIERDAYRPGRIPAIDPKIVEAVVEKTTRDAPAGATHWTAARMAKEAGISESSVLRIWRRHGLKPHRVHRFKVSNDPRFVEKLEDVVGLYLAPPEHALVLCVDEKSQIQALDRTQPGLPIKKGRAGTMTHDYKRHGTTTLFAALSVADGQVIGACHPRHTHQEWLKFLRLIDRETPPDKELHLIADNYATHKHPAVLRWLKRHPRFHMHFTPTSSSWLNMVERFFRDLTVQSVRRGVFRSVAALIAAIEEHLRVHNAAPKPFIWTAKATDILAKVTRARAKLQTIQSA